MNESKTMVSKELLRLWTIANAEAWFCQASNIEPVHFWIAALKLADPDIAGAMLENGAAPEECEAQSQLSKQLLAYLEMTPEETAKFRRRERAKILNGRAPRGMPEDGPPYLHRSESSRRLFQIALRKAESRKSSELTPMHRLESLFDMNLVSLPSS